MLNFLCNYSLLVSKLLLTQRMYVKTIYLFLQPQQGAQETTHALSVTARWCSATWPRKSMFWVWNQFFLDSDVFWFFQLYQHLQIFWWNQWSVSSSSSNFLIYSFHFHKNTWAYKFQVDRNVKKGDVTGHVWRLVWFLSVSVFTK